MHPCARQQSKRCDGAQHCYIQAYPALHACIPACRMHAAATREEGGGGGCM